MNDETVVKTHQPLRRRDIGRMTAEELMLFYALIRIEHMGTDPRLVDGIHPGHKMFRRATR